MPEANSRLRAVGRPGDAETERNTVHELREWAVSSADMRQETTRMRAFAFDAFGEQGSVRELPVPDPGEGQLRLRVVAAGVNRSTSR